MTVRHCLIALLVAASPAAAQSPFAADSAAMIASMGETARAWNQADLDGHVAAYADSAVFMAPGPIVGRDRTRAALERSFWREGRPVQQLRFEQLNARPLGADRALMTGRFILSGGGQEERSGWYTLIWERIDGRWRIVHDHSS